MMKWNVLFLLVSEYAQFVTPRMIRNDQNVSNIMKCCLLHSEYTFDNIWYDLIILILNWFKLDIYIYILDHLWIILDHSIYNLYTDILMIYNDIIAYL